MFVFVVAIPALLGGVLAIVVDDDPLVVPTGVTQPPSSDVAEPGPFRGTAGGPAAAATAPTAPGSDTSDATDGAAAAEVATPPSGDPLVRLRDWLTLLTVDVALGDSLLGLAGEYSTSVEAIQLLNGLLEDDQIIEGQELLIPLGFGDPLTAADVVLGLPSAEESDAEPAAEEELSAAELLAMWPNLVDVVVEAGDTPGRLAGLYGTTSEAVIAYNGLEDAASLFLGATVTIPVGFTESLEEITDADVGVGVGVGGGEVEIPISDSPGLDGSDERNLVALVALFDWTDVTEWTVLPGDNLVAIAREFSTTIEVIAFYNNISAEESILIGQTLNIPVGFRLSLTTSGG
jgi:LysM repeat protein